MFGTVDNGGSDEVHRPSLGASHGEAMINLNLKKLLLRKENVDPYATRIAEMAEEVSSTPDIWRLEQYKRQRIFVADNVLDEQLREASFVGQPVWPECCYTHDKYTLWKKDLGAHSYSVILPENYRPTGFVRYPVEPAKIQGKLWAVSPTAFISLDKLRDNGVRFTRSRVRISLPWRFVAYSKKKPLPEISRDFLHTLDAWVYFGVPDYWDAMIGGIFASSQIEPSEHVHPRQGKFFRFANPPFE